jgi:hypothetical protein
MSFSRILTIEKIDSYLSDVFLSDEAIIHDICYLSDVEDDINNEEHVQPEFAVDENEADLVFNHFCDFGRKYNLIWKNPNLHDIGRKNLFRDSSYLMNDFSLALLNLRQQFPDCIGDRLMASMIGIFAKFLERDNCLEEYLSSSSSYYCANQLLYHSVVGENSPFRCLAFQKCNRGCITFAGEFSQLESCPKCNELKDDSDQYFYLPFADRFKRLITSPLLRKLFHYDEYRVAKEGYITDVYDSHVWKTFESKMGINEKLIGLEVSWDGARHHPQYGQFFTAI